MPGIRPQFASKSVYDYRTDSTVKQPIVDEGSNAAFDIVYSDAQGVKKAVSGLQVRLLMVILCKGNFSCAHCVKLCQPYLVSNSAI